MIWESDEWNSGRSGRECGAGRAVRLNQNCPRCDIDWLARSININMRRKHKRQTQYANKQPTNNKQQTNTKGMKIEDEGSTGHILCD